MPDSLLCWKFYFPEHIPMHGMKRGLRFPLSNQVPLQFRQPSNSELQGLPLSASQYYI